MELTPSVMSHSSSKNDNYGNEGGRPSMGHTDFKDEPLRHNQSNDSIMNPRIQGGSHDATSSMPTVGESRTINSANNNIKILE